MHLRNSVSRLLIPRPRILPPGDSAKTSMKEDRLSRSQRLLTEAGYIQQESNGYFTLLPLGLKSLGKLEALIDESLRPLGCQRMRWPSLSPASLWEASGRKMQMGPELMTVKNRRGKTYILAPTHEESVASFFSSLHLSYKSLPLLVYQISNKYRDELNPKFGLLRANEFLMKDLYSFDVDEASADATYERVREAYDVIFKKLEVPFVRVLGSGSSMGSKVSHEYHYFVGSSGQDKVGKCGSCGAQFNMEVVTGSSCPVCEGPSVVPYEDKAIEIAHTFKLENKYSSILKARFKDVDGKMRNTSMCCFGIGVSRLLAASAEALSSESTLRWPKAIAPFQVSVITPKKGSKEFIEASSRAHAMIDDVLSFMSSQVLIDDTENKTIGSKLRHAKELGIPLIIVFGKSSCRPQNPCVEIHTYEDKVLEIPETHVKDFVIKFYHTAY